MFSPSSFSDPVVAGVGVTAVGGIYAALTAGSIFLTYSKLPKPEKLVKILEEKMGQKLKTNLSKKELNQLVQIHLNQKEYEELVKGISVIDLHDISRQKGSVVVAGTSMAISGTLLLTSTASLTDSISVGMVSGLHIGAGVSSYLKKAGYKSKACMAVFLGKSL